MIREAIQYIAAMSGPSVHTANNGQVAITRSDSQAIEYLTTPARRRAHVLYDLADFSDFIQSRADSTADVIFDSSKHRAVADFAPGQQVAASDVISCQIQKHPRLARWLSVFGQQLEHKEFYRLFATADDADFSGLDEVAGATVRELIASNSRQLQVNKSKDFSTELDPRGFYKVRSQNDANQITIKFPTEFTLFLPWYIGRELEDIGYAISVLIEVELDEKRGVVFTLRAPSLKLTEQQAARDAVGLLRKWLPDDWLVVQGMHDAKEVEVY